MTKTDADVAALREALEGAWEEIRAWRSGKNHRNMNKCKVGAVFIEERKVREALAR